MPASKLTLTSRRWYTWQALSGDESEALFRPCTPIFATDVEPLKTGKGILRVSFVAALRPVAPVRRTVNIRIAFHRADHLIGTLRDADGDEHTVVVREPDFAWLEHYCTEFWFRFPPSHFERSELGFTSKVEDAQTYLSEAFGADEERILAGTTPTSFGAPRPPMPDRHTVIRLDIPFSPFDSFLIRRGFRPEQMEEKWFIYFHDGKLWMRRSWTGLIIYEIAFEERGDSLLATSARVNRDPEQYKETDDERDRGMIFYLIRRILLGLPAAYPVADGLSPEQAALSAWSMAGKASLG